MRYWSILARIQRLMTNKITSDVTVDLCVRISINSTWGEHTTIAQVHNQARKEAELTIKKALSGKVKILDGMTLNVFSKI